MTLAVAAAFEAAFHRKPTAEEVGRLERVMDVLDVRENDEWVAGHAPQARHVPLDTLPSITFGPGDPGRIIVVCRSGRRSDAATMHLRGLGLDAYNLIGGMQAWQQAGGPVISDDETPGRVI